MSKTLIRPVSRKEIIRCMKKKFKIGDRVIFLEKIREEKNHIVEVKRRGTIIYMNDYYTAVQTKSKHSTITTCILHTASYYHSRMRKA